MTQTVATKYDEKFYDRLKSGVERSASTIVPIALELTGAKSVIDIGCGSGHWLKHFRSNGIQDLLGVDGAWVTSSELLQHEFQAVDLSKPFSIGRTFDLAISLEVAEHLPPTSAAGFVASVATLAPVVLFSAAIPGQGGVDHLNEQWPEYWQSLFESHGFVAVDAIRPRIWESREVEPWYAQNSILYVKEEQLRGYPSIGRESNRFGASLSVVHPRHYESRLHAAERAALSPDPTQLPLSTLLRIAPGVMRNALKRLAGR